MYRVDYVVKDFESARQRLHHEAIKNPAKSAIVFCKYLYSRVQVESGLQRK